MKVSDLQSRRQIAKLKVDKTIKMQSKYSVHR